MSEIISLSSSDEEDISPPLKKIKQSESEKFSISESIKNTLDIVILSDDDNEDIINSKTSVCNRNSQKEELSIDIKERTFSVIVPDGQTKSIVNDCKNETIQDFNKDKDENVKDNCNIVIDDNSSASSSGKENESENGLSTINELNGPSTSVIPIHDTLIEKYLVVCEESIINSQYEHLKDKQFTILRKYYKKCGAKLSENSNFIKLIEENIIRAKKSPATAVISFNEIFQYVKEVAEAEIMEVSEEHKIKLKKLEKTIKLLVRKIKQLENAEVNFDEEEDSTYIQLDRYTNRLAKVHQKYCELLKKNPYTGRITYEKLDFVDSEYNEINRAISKKYKNNKKFPSYYEMEQYIRKVVTDHKLDLSESKIKGESIRCFKKLGELLQNRRKKELYDAHYMYIRDTEDPANVDKSLDSTLKQNFTEGQVKIEKVCEAFSIKEELREEVTLSEENSNETNSEDSEKEDDDS